MTQIKRDVIAKIEYEIQMCYSIKAPELFIDMCKRKLSINLAKHKLVLNKYINLLVTDEIIDELFENMRKYHEEFNWIHEMFPPSEDKGKQNFHEKWIEFIDVLKLQIESQKEFIINN